MKEIKTKAIKGIEEKMEHMDKDSLRYQVLKTVKLFKTSWVSLGEALYTVWKDKLYRGWGYTGFDTYTAKEIGIKKNTALKLLKSYYFLEKEEPDYIQRSRDNAEIDVASLPTYESVNVLRIASGKKDIDTSDYEHIKKDVLLKGKDARDVRKELVNFVRQRRELEPQDTWQEKKLTVVKRLLSTLKSIKKEIEISKILSAQIVKETNKLIEKLEAEIS